MPKNPFGDTPIGETNPFGDTPINQVDIFQGQEVKPQVGFGSNLYRTGVGALRDTAQATTELIEDAGSLVGADFNIPDLPTIPQPTYPGGGIARDVAGFLVPYAGLSKLTKGYKAVTTPQKVAKTTALGSTAEQFAFSPDEERLSNLIQEYPNLQNPITEYLQSDLSDSAAEGRFKMALEGAGLGLAVEGLLRSFGKLRANKFAQEQPEALGPPKPEELKQTFVGPKNEFGDTPILETPVAPKVETPKPKSNKLPDILIPPKEPKIKRVNSLLFGNVPFNDPGLEEIASALGYSTDTLPLVYKAKNAKTSVATGEAISDTADNLAELLGELGFARNVPGGKLTPNEALEILQSNPVLPEFEDAFIKYDTALRNYDEVEGAFKRAGIKLENFKGKTNQEVDDVYKEIIDIESTGVATPEGFGARFEPLPPVESYEDVITKMDSIRPQTIYELDNVPPDFAGNINLNKIDAPDKVKNVIDDIAKNNDDFMEARRGVVRFGSDGEELAALAKETGLTEDQLINRKKGSAFNAETAYAARVLNIESATNLTKLAKKAQGTNATPEDMFAFEEALNRHVAIQEQIAGITAEAGRTLRSFRETVASADVLKSKAIKDYIQAKGGGERIEEMATFISNLDTPEQIAKFTKDAVKPKFKDKLQELWINSLLSSPSTHIVNVVSNGIVAATRMPEYAVASLLGAGRKGSDKVSFTETGGRIYGSMYGFLDGMRAFKNALIDPSTVDDPLTKLELQRQNSISGIKGEVVRLPGRFLTAEDQLFKSVGYRQELWGQAIRKAKSEGKGIKRAYEIMDDPAKNFPDIELKARDTARYQTFTNPLGPTGQSVQKIIQNHPWTRYIAPFVRTPVNIVKYAGQRTPLGVFAKSYKEAIKKGGAEADLARARVIVGSTAMASMAMLANDGLVTGRGPADYREKSILRETGWQPYSIRVGDTYYAYNRFEPVGILFGLAADWSDIYKYVNKEIAEENELELGELAAMMAASFTENITNKTFLTGISDFINVMFNPDRYGEASIQRFLASFVPTASYYVRKNNDPLIRDSQSVMDSFYNRIPGLSTELPARRNVFGEERRFQEGAAPAFLGNLGKTFSPVAKSTITNDVVFNELANLNITPSTPKRTIGGVDLTPKQYESLLMEMIPLQTKAKLEFIINSPDYQSLLPLQKTDMIKTIIQNDQKAARDLTAATYPNIIDDQIIKMMEQLNQ